ncbi:MAG: hypothetical protein Q9165_008256 [Trypethelium subeluteriae]
MSETLGVKLQELDESKGFLSYGGNSMSAVDVYSRCKHLGIQLSVRDVLSSSCIREVFERAKVMKSPRCPSPKRQKLTSGNQSLHQSSEAVVEDNSTLSTAVPSLNLATGLKRPSDLQRTEMQQVFAMESAKHPGTNIIRFYQSFPSHHIPALKAAWRRVLEIEHVSNSRQKARALGIGTEQTLDLDHDPPDHICSSDEELKHLLESSIDDPSTISKLRTASLRSSPQCTTMIWDVNHAVIDGYSAKLLYQKVRRLAEGLQISPGTPFTKVAQELTLFQKQRSESHKRFWTQRKKDHPNATGQFCLGYSKGVSTSCTFSSVTLDRGLDDQIWCSNHHITLAALYYSAWSLVLSTYTNSDCVVFGAIVSGRGLPIRGVEDTIGPLVNTLPFFINIDWYQTCLQHVRNVFKLLLSLEEVESSSAKDGFSRGFDSGIAMEVEMPSFKEFNIQAVDECSFNIRSGVPLSLTFNSAGKVHFRYRQDIINAPDVEMLCKQFDMWLTVLISSSQSLQSSRSKIAYQCYGSTMLRNGNFGLASTMLSSMSEDLVTLFEKTTTKHPDLVAIRKGASIITYAELDKKASQVARFIEDFINPGDVICVHSDRSINWLIATYATLKAGAIYAPVNLAMPAATRAVNYQTVNAALYLAQYAWQRSSAPREARVMSVDELLELSSLERSLPHKTSPQPEAPAYVCFTSGSTSTPKAVLCTHGSVVAFQKDLVVRLYAQPGQNVAQIMAPAFDGCIHEIFSTLSYGGTLVLPAVSDDLYHLEDCDSAILTPSLAGALCPDDYPRLRQVYFVGEPVSQRVCDTWASSKRVFNMYGPTESTCGATIKELCPKAAITIGRPNPSSRVYILDRHKQPCPPNVIGEIYTAGVQVALGYYGLNDLNVTRFLPDPFFPGTKEKMYATGDRGYWTSSAEICCLGRSDRQVKLRGFRLDLNALEEQILGELHELTGIALVKKDDFLQAAIAPASIDISSLKSQLAAKLPVYAMPRYFHPMDAIPKTVISKVDYTAIEALAPPSIQYPSTPRSGDIEAILSDVLRDIYNLDRSTLLEPHSMLSDLGGDSLTQLTLANQLSHAFDRTISVRQIIGAATLHDLAHAIGSILDEYLPLEESIPSEPFGGVSPREADWIRKYAVKAGTSTFNVSVVWQVDSQAVDLDKLTAAWNAVLAQDDLFSCYFVVDPAHRLYRAFHDSTPRVELVEEINLREILDTPFKPSTDYLIRVLISPSLMVLVISHIICDLTTVQILLKDVALLYQNPRDEITKPEPSYRHSIPQVHHQRDLDFWSHSLSAAPSMQMWRKLPPRQNFGGRSDARWLPRPLFQRLARFSRTKNLTLHQLALAATALTLQHTTETTDIVLGAPFMNRNRQDLTTKGLFLEPLPIRITRAASKDKESLSAFLVAVRQASQNALAHQIPWAHLLQHLNTSCPAPENPFFDVMVTFHDLRQKQLPAIPGLEQLQSWSAGSKFKLMLEFSVFDEESLLLRLEYDTSCFDQADVNRIHTLVVMALFRLTTNVTVHDLRREMFMSVSNLGRRANSVQVGSSLRTT